MITEDYVSFETAKLLKEKGFDWECFQYWHEIDNLTCFKIELVHSQSMYPIQNISNPCFFGPAAPTLQMAMKWLREVHKLWCEISWEGKNAWFVDIFSLDEEQYVMSGHKMHKVPSYEEACDAAIKYCLENLI